ncbi:glycosyltransferase family 2 protein [Vibrio cyclitrophicus]
MNLAVLIPCYNSRDLLLDTLKSFSCIGVGIIIVDDGSDIELNYDEILECAVGAKEVILFKNNINIGITESLNIGLKIAHKNGFEYVARLDAGDICLDNRIKKQYEFMEKNELDLCGSFVEFVDDDGNHLFNFTPPETDFDLKRAIKKYNPFIHPAVMFKLSSVLNVGGYPISYPALEDWALFMALSKKYKMGNVPDVLLKYVVSSQSISTLKRETQARSKVKLLIDNFDLNVSSIIGIVRNLIVLYIPREFLTQVKRFVYRWK